MLPITDLTKRERQVVQALLEGKTNRQIAEELVIAVPTVQTHLNRIYCKLGVSTRLEAVVSVFQFASELAKLQETELRARWPADLHCILDPLCRSARNQSTSQNSMIPS